jgi:hypothetical protein
MRRVLLACAAIALGAMACGSPPATSAASLDPRVTQETLTSTVCTRGWTASVRPPVSITEPIKRELVATEYPGGRLSDYVLDHRVPLELGGSSDRSNLWLQTITDAKHKDEVETFENHEACAGHVSLAEAQQQTAVNWQAVYTQLHQS